ncbi:MAG: isoprenyl transferase [Acidobacteriota bacterium]
MAETKDLEGFIPSGTPDHEHLRGLDFARLPRHVAIIMDGNGRWARQRGLPRVSGHRAGIDSVRETVECSARLGLQILTLYAFSIENWKRPRAEIAMLMMLLREYLNKELVSLQKNNIILRAIGRIEDLDPSVQREIRKVEEATSGNTGLVFNVALSYGGRAEIVDACRSLVLEARRGNLDPLQIDETLVSRHLYTSGQPDPDLLIRTSGEFRISNFLLWQIAYSEIWVTETLWPDFRRGELLRAIADFQKRQRRYGGLEVEATPVTSSPEQRILV